MREHQSTGGGTSDAPKYAALSFPPPPRPPSYKFAVTSIFLTYYIVIFETNFFPGVSLAMGVGILVLRFRGYVPYCEVFDRSFSSAERESCNKLSGHHIFHPSIPPAQSILHEFANLVRDLKVWFILIYIPLLFRLWYMS
jgi:hypothetical protein